MPFAHGSGRNSIHSLRSHSHGMGRIGSAALREGRLKSCLGN